MDTYEEKITPFKKRDLCISYFVLFIDNLGWSVVFPVFSPLILDSKYHFVSADLPPHFRKVFLAIVLVSYPLTLFIGAPFFGDFSDRWGRRKAFLFTLTGIGIGFVLSALFVMMKSFSGLVLARLFTGFFAGNATISYAMIADVSQNKKERIEKFAVGAIFAGLGYIGGIFLGTEVFYPTFFLHLNPSDPFWMIAIFTGIALLVVLFLFSESHLVTEKSSFSIQHIFLELKIAMSHPRFRVLLSAFSCRSLAWTLVLLWVVNVSLEKYHFSEERLRYFLVASGLITVIVNLLVVFVFVKLFSIFKLVTLGFLCAGVALFFAISSETLWYTVFYLIMVIFGSLTWNIRSLISLNTMQEDQGLILGVLQSIYALSMVIGPLIAAGLTFITLSTPFYFSSILFIVGFCILILWKIRHKVQIK